MVNPWNQIPLEAYERHMTLSSVRQLQVMNQMMAEQFSLCPPDGTAMVLGVAGGNGLEHVDPTRIRTVYGVDLNHTYLAACADRYSALSGTLVCLQADLTAEGLSLPHADIVLANLLVEYIGYGYFQRAVKQVAPLRVSCAIQINTDDGFVSDSPYFHVFDRLSEVHHQLSAAGLSAAMTNIGYRLVSQSPWPLPNGKELLQLDYEKCPGSM